ncbi:MAG: DUF1015 domain-containing protein [Deltaproteobacteria bacterium]|nr:DUF1015 domain-containing protein [Deltaproteobacteria bacterium]
MAMIRPFRGVRYNPALVEDFSRVVSPPYDVISPEQQTLLHLRSPYNAVHLDFNQDSERYTAAAERLRDWLARDVLIRENEPALYFYSQEFTSQGGGKRRRIGVLAALRLEEFSSGIIRPHERTFEGAKKDRLDLLRSCQTHLSPIFCLYARKEWSLAQVAKSALAQPPLISLVDDKDVTHQVWNVTDPSVIAEVTKGLEQESLIIADGHHRYETALRYRQERGAQGQSSGEEPYNFVMAYLTNAYDDGLVILPTHRLLQEVTMPNLRDLRTVLQRDFHVGQFALDQRGAFLTALSAPGPGRRIGSMFAGAGYYWLLSFDDRATRNLQHLSPQLRSLDVTVLHDILLQQFLGLSPEMQKQKLSYTIDADEALQRVIDRKYQAAFLLNPTSYDQVARVCGQAETMPQKSTYFYPKLLTGLVFQQV